MILKCAQHIRLSEHSHHPKLIKSYIAISCLIKATLCSENPAQLSNGCYSMKTEEHFSYGGGRGEKKRKKEKKTNILFVTACREWNQPRCAKMKRVLSHASVEIFAPAGNCESMTEQADQTTARRVAETSDLALDDCVGVPIITSCVLAVSSWTDELQTIDTLNILQLRNGYRSLWPCTLLSFTSCWSE